MSCRPSRDFPSLSNKIPGEQAAGVWQGACWRPALTRQDACVPKAQQQRVPWGAERASALQPTVAWACGKARPLFSNQRWLSSPHPPGKPPPFLWPPQSLLSQAGYQAPPWPDLSTHPAWVLRLTSRSQGLQDRAVLFSSRLGEGGILRPRLFMNLASVKSLVSALLD